MRAMQERLATVAAGLCGLGWYLWLGGGHTLAPGEVSWLLTGDWNQAFAGWNFVRAASPSLPLALAPGLLHPWGTSAALTDSIPLLAAPLQLVAGGLPERFQYFGLWLAAAFVLLGVVGARLARALGAEPLVMALAGALLSMSPPTYARLGHLSLTAHWLLLLAFLLHLGAGWKARTRLALGLGLVLMGCGVHAYLAAMLVALVLALVARERLLGGVGWVEAAAWLLGVAVTAAAGFWLWGFLVVGPSSRPGEGFGEFSADLLSLVNPMNFGRLVPNLPFRGRQGEGMGYLGLGVLVGGTALVAVALVRDRRALAPPREAWALLAMCLGLWVYALSSKVSLAGQVVLDVSWLYAPLSPLTGVFRSSGRFIWPLQLLLTVGAVGLAVRLLPGTALRAAALLGMLALQAADLRQDISGLRQPVVPFAPLGDPAWAALREYRHLALVPMHLQWVCRYDEALVTRLGWEAWRARVTFNSGHVGRTADEVPTHCEERLTPAAFDVDTVYVVAADFLKDFEALPVVCGVVERLPVCVSKDKPSALLSAVERQRLF